MPRIVAAGFILAALALPLSAETALSLSVSPGVTFGEGTSFVYYKQDGSAYTISKLDWPLYPAWSGQVAASARLSRGFRLDARFSAGIPANSGTVYDSDYLNQPTSDVKTHLSVHDGSLQHSVDAELRAGWKFDIPFGIEASPWASFRYIRYKWLARDGYTQYASDTNFKPATPYHDPWTEDVYRSPSYGNAIEYEQEFFVPLAGLSIDWHALPSLTVSASCGIAPWLRANALDNHLSPTKNNDYNDILSGGFCVEPALSVFWLFSRETSVFLSGEGTFINGLTGYTLMRENSGGTITKTDDGTAGAALNAGTIRLGVETRLR